MTKCKTRTEWIDLLHKCQNGDSTCMFVLGEIERELDVLANLRDEALDNNRGLAKELRELEKKRHVHSIQNQRFRAELNNIANAKPSEWGDMSDQFQAWAQNRARHVLSDLPNV